MADLHEFDKLNFVVEIRYRLLFLFDLVHLRISLFLQVCSHMVDLFTYAGMKRKDEHMVIVAFYVCAYILRVNIVQDEMDLQVLDSRFDIRT